MPRLEENQISQDVNGYYRLTKAVEPHPGQRGAYRPKVWALGRDHRQTLERLAPPRSAFC
jgi:hypothetical protein